MSSNFSRDEINNFLSKMSQIYTPYEIRVDGEFSFIQTEFIDKVINWLEVPFFFYCLENKKDTNKPHSHFWVPTNGRDAEKLAKSIRAKITNTFPQLKGRTQYKVGVEKQQGMLLPYILKGEQYYFVEIEKGATAKIINLLDGVEFSQTENDIMTIILKSIKECYNRKNDIDEQDEQTEHKVNKLAFDLKIREAFALDMEKIKSQNLKGGSALMEIIRKWVCRYVLKNKWNHCEPSAVNKLTFFLLAEIEEEYAVEELYRRAKRKDIDVY